MLQYNDAQQKVLEVLPAKPAEHLSSGHDLTICTNDRNECVCVCV